MADWKTYDGKYEKAEYLIRTRDGEIVGPCWPNAGYFHPLDGGKRIDGEDVVEMLRVEAQAVHKPTVIEIMWDVEKIERKLRMFHSTNCESYLMKAIDLTEVLLKDLKNVFSDEVEKKGRKEDE